MIFTIVPQPDKGMSFADVIVGSFSLTAIAIVVAAVLGVILAYILIHWHRRHPPEDDHLPSISPLIAGPAQSSSKSR
jgi:ABC-type phosphate transport system permease subunit